MTEAKSVKMSYDVAGGDFDRAGEASANIKRMLQKIGIPADIVRRVAIGTYEAEMNVLIHAGGGTVNAEIFTDHTVINISDHGAGGLVYRAGLYPPDGLRRRHGAAQHDEVQR